MLLPDWLIATRTASGRSAPSRKWSSSAALIEVLRMPWRASSLAVQRQASKDDPIPVSTSRGSAAAIAASSSSAGRWRASAAPASRSACGCSQISERKRSLPGGAFIRPPLPRPR